jgi:hypothetical protein
MDCAGVAACGVDQVGREALRIVEQDFQQMVWEETLVAFAQRQHLGALQEAAHALRVLFLVHHSTLLRRPRSTAGERADPYPGILRPIWERTASAQDRIQGMAFRCNVGAVCTAAE